MQQRTSELEELKAALKHESAERRRAEEALRETESGSRLAIDGIPGFVATLAPNGAVEVVNRKIIEYTGQPLEGLREWGTNGTVHPDDMPHVASIFIKSIAAGVPYEIEQRLRRHDGEYRWFDNRGVPVCDASGRVLRWYVLLTDIDEKRRSEEELRRSEAFLAQAQRLSLTGSFSWLLSPDEITLSDELHRILEFAKGTPVTREMIGARVHPEDRLVLTEQLERSRAGLEEHDWELRLQMPDDRIKWVHVFMRRVPNRNDRVEYLGSIQDMTQRRLSEQALDRVRSELAHVTRVMSLGALTASVAHEVNQPLSGIITNASTCLRMLAADPPNIDGALETARRTVRDGNRAAEVIGRLRSLFSKKTAKSQRVDLNEAAAEVVALVSSDLQRNRVVVKTDFDRELPALAADRVQLQQVILNLLMNASDAMISVHDRERLALIKTARDGDGGVRFSVQDAGVGFATEDTERLFHAFYTTKTNGMGIGLSVSRSIIESHEGRLWGEPNRGPGATFSFSMPVTSIEERPVA